MKLTYWYAECLDDNDCYSVRERTKKAAQTEKSTRDIGRFGKVVKVTVEYADGFDLLTKCVGEGGLWEEAEAAQNANE